MKKYIFLFAFLLVIPLSRVHAGNAFLNVGVSVSNDHGGQLKPADFQYEIKYDGKTDLIFGPVQAYGFAGHDESLPLVYSVSVVQKAGYTSKLSDSGCSKTVETNNFSLVNCFLYQSDDGYPLPVVASSPEVGEFGVVSEHSTNGSVEPVVTTLTENQEVIMSLQLQLIDLLRQLIALLQEKARLGL